METVVPLETALVLAAPIIVGAMLLEAHVGRRRGIQVYRWSSVVSDLSCGVASILGRSVVGVSAIGCYAFVEEHFALFELDAASPLVWLVAFVFLDLVLWLRHWACHRVGFLWAIHAVHHQSRDLNLGTANRVPWLQDLQMLPFIFAAAILGFPTSVIAASLGISAAWALLTHTQVVGRLGWLEAVFITPSHHRVHHAMNGSYLDRNFGSVLVVWDKLFGTFEAETLTPAYGTHIGTGAESAVWANAGPVAELLTRGARAPTWAGALETALRPPGWDPVSRRESDSTQLGEDVGADARTPTLALGLLAVTAAAALAPLYLDVTTTTRLLIGAAVVLALVLVPRVANRDRAR